jgi:hypothetical protein
MRTCDEAARWSEAAPIRLRRRRSVQRDAAQLYATGAPLVLRKAFILKVVEGKGFEGRDPKFLENLRDAIVRNAAKRGRPRPTASHLQDHQPEAPAT